MDQFAQINLVQDPCYNVRMEFLMKLFPLLTARKLPPRYNLIPFLTVHDPEADVKNRVGDVLRIIVPLSNTVAGHLLCYTRITKHIRK